MTDYHVLVLDEPQGPLGPVAVRLIRAGVNVLYAPHPEEARLLMWQDDSDVRALIVHPQADAAVVRSLFEEGSGPDGTEMRAVIAVGPAPTPEVRARLRAAGAEWAIFGRYDDSALRFVLNTAVSLPEELSPRREARAPCMSFAWIQLGSTRNFGVFYSLSAGGAYVETATPVPKGSLIDLEFQLEKRCYQVRAEVIYRNDAGDTASRNLPPGMGVLFRDISERDETTLRAWCTQRAEQYRL